MSLPVINSPETLTSTGVSASQARQLFDGNPDGMYFGWMFCNADGVISEGTKASVAGSGIPLALVDDFGAFRVFTDDNGVNIPYSVRGVQSRTLLTTSQSAGTIRALQGQLKALTGVNFATGVYDAVQGYIELPGSNTVSSGGALSCIDASLEIGTALTATGNVFGLHIETTGAGTLSGGGIAAGIGIFKSGSAAWPNAIYIAAGACTAGLVFGAKSSSAAIGHHIGIANSADTAGDKAIAVFADDANAVLASDAQGINSRCLILAAQNGHYAMTSLRGHLRVVASVTPAESKAFQGTAGYVEASGTYTFGDGTNQCIMAALDGTCELSGTPTIASNAYVAGVHLCGKFTAASYTGITCAILIEDINYGFQALLAWPAVQGMLSVGSDSVNVTHKVAVKIGTATRYIHLFSD